jgi:hypothetical protein
LIDLRVFIKFVEAIDESAMQLLICGVSASMLKGCPFFLLLLSFLDLDAVTNEVGLKNELRGDVELPLP